MIYTSAVPPPWVLKGTTEDRQKADGCMDIPHWRCRLVQIAMPGEASSTDPGREEHLQVYYIQGINGLKRSKTYTRLKERFLIERNRTKLSNFRGSPLFLAAYDIKIQKQTID